MQGVSSGKREVARRQLSAEAVGHGSASELLALSRRVEGAQSQPLSPSLRRARVENTLPQMQQLVGASDVIVAMRIRRQPQTGNY